jgi:carboxyl-terminal processing protease
MFTESGPARRTWAVAGIIVVFMVMSVGFYRNTSAKSDETYKGLKMLSDVIEIVEKNYVDPVDSRELIEEAVQGMVHGLDPHSTLLTPDAFKELQIDTQGEFTGIGVSITVRDGVVTVISPIEGTPAYKAGIRAGDKILKVNDKPIKDLREAVKQMRGPKGTEVVVTIMREGAPEPMIFSLVRDLIPIESVRYTLLKPGFGYIWVTHFREQTSNDLEEALIDLETGDEPLRGLILDLRDNPGGLLPQAIQVSDLFLDKGDILSIKGRLAQHTKNYTAQKDPTPREYPMVVLINGGSASASEIVAGALQDNKRAVILGTQSFGKGSVQTVEALREGYGLKLTIARYYTPSGRSIQATGIQPDIIVTEREIAGGSGAADGLLREKDLQNHLEAEPDKDDDLAGPDTDKTPADNQSKRRERMRDQGPLNLDRLRSDNQVMRALDILVGHEIFAGDRA